jgi:hypothetical protein
MSTRCKFHNPEGVYFITLEGDSQDLDSETLIVQ